MRMIGISRGDECQLMTEVKDLADLATLKATEQKADTLPQQVMGPDEQQQQDYRTRETSREPLGERIAREVILTAR